MIEPDARDHRNILTHHIRRVETPAHSDFEDRELDAVAEVHESHRGRQFEVGRRIEERGWIRGRRGDFLVDGRKVGIRDLVGTDSESLIEALQMR